MVLVRRFLVLIALMFWQGGFTFYVSVAVPIGTAVLGSALRQGFITRQVTGWLNVSAAVALAVLAAELALCHEASRWRKWSRAVLWAFMLACQVQLFRLHAILDAMMEEKGRLVLDPEAFYPIHRVYLWTHTAQWAAGLVFVAVTLLAWRAEDRTGR
ncbi:MAG: hypothetical protein U0797_23500 [Gemmataceae bacterium]